MGRRPGLLSSHLGARYRHREERRLGNAETPKESQ